MALNYFTYKSNVYRQLKGFCAVVEMGGVEKAAKSMLLTQPTVSAQIRSLERDLDEIMFDRSKKPLELTDVGKRFYDDVAPVINKMDSVIENFLIKEENHKVKSLKVVSNHICILHLLPKYIKLFSDKYEDVDVILSNLQRDKAFEMLFKDQVDMMLYPMVEIPHGLDFIPIADFDPILLTRRDHPLVQKDWIDLHDVKKEQLLTIDKHLFTLPMFVEVIENHGLTSKFEFENSDWEILKRYVREGLGVAMISNICVDDDDPDLVGRPIPEYFPKMTYGMCVKKGKILSEQCENFIKLIREFSNYDE